MPKGLKRPIKIHHQGATLWVRPVHLVQNVGLNFGAVRVLFLAAADDLDGDIALALEVTTEDDATKGALASIGKNFVCKKGGRGGDTNEILENHGE